MQFKCKLAVAVVLLGLAVSLTAMAGITDDLVAYYPFDNTLNDEGENAIDGTSVGSGRFTEDRYGRENFAFELIQDTGNVYTYIDLENPEELRPESLSSGMTIAAWIRMNSVNQSQPIFTNNGRLNYGFFMKVNSSGYLVFGYGDGASEYTITSLSTVEAGEWRHVVGLIRSPNSDPRMALYIDGELESGAASPSPSNGVAYDAAVPGYIGRRVSEETEFDGDMDDVRFYDTAKTQSDITKLYNGEILIEIPESLTEDDEVMEDAGKIRIFKPSDSSDITFTLSSSDEKKIKVGSVTVPRGETEALFDITLIDNNESEDDKTVTITVDHASYIRSSAKIIVRDDESVGCFITTLIK